MDWWELSLGSFMLDNDNTAVKLTQALHQSLTP